VGSGYPLRPQYVDHLFVMRFLLEANVADNEEGDIVRRRLGERYQLHIPHPDALLCPRK
jgi:hypothetical protein